MDLPDHYQSYCTAFSINQMSSSAEPWSLFENQMCQHPPRTIEYSIKIKRELLAPSRVNLWYRGPKHADIEAARKFIAEAADLPGVEIDTGATDWVFDNAAPHEISRLILGLDMRPKLDNSRIKLWLILRRHARKISQILDSCEVPHIHRFRAREGTLGFGIDLYFDGTSKKKIYPLLNPAKPADQKVISQELGIISAQYAQACHVLHVSFHEPEIGIVAHLMPKNPWELVNQLHFSIDNLEPTIKKCEALGLELLNISIPVQQLESDRITDTNLYFMKDWK